MEKRVLLIDGDVEFADLVAKSLEPMGVALTTIADDAEAIARARSAPPDLLLLAELPERDVFTMCNRIKRTEGLETVPVVLLTGGAAPHAIESHQASRTPADAYLEHDAWALLDALGPILGLPASAPDAEPLPLVDESVVVRLEAELADVRGELGAKIAELEGEVEALREEGELRQRELDGQAQLLAAIAAERDEALEKLRKVEGGGNQALLAMLHAELSDSQTERERLATALAGVNADRERLQDELAAQIAGLASDLASRDAEIAALQRKNEAHARAAQGLQAERDRLASEVEDLKADNGFLTAEVDRIAAQLAQVRK